MACTGRLRRNIGWGAGFLPDALEMLWTHSKDNGQHFLYGWRGYRSHGGRCLEKWIMGQCL